MNNNIIIQKLDPIAGLYKATPGSAGFDIINISNVTIEPRTKFVQRCGFKIKLPKNTFAMLASRSSTRMKGIDVFAGVIDEDFCSEISIVYENSSDTAINLIRGERYVQLIVIPYISNKVILEVTSIAQNGKAHTGFGSTNQA